MKLNLLAALCIAVLGTILTLGLWPFHAPANDVSWLGYRNGLQLGRYASIMSSGPLSAPPQENSEASIEIWLQPGRIWDSSTFLSFYKSGNLFQFSLHQVQTDLLVFAVQRDEQRHSRPENLWVKDAFPKTRPLFITLTSGSRGAVIYLDGKLATAASQFPMSANYLSGDFILGDRPGQGDNWSGRLLGFAVYHHVLAAGEVEHHFDTWTRNGRPDVSPADRIVALYLLNERSGKTARDAAGSGIDLKIPDTYKVIDKIALEPFWTEFSMSRSYWSAALKNIIGFVPLGFCFYAYAILLLRRRAAMMTVFAGAAVSVTIEVLQAFLPTRDSGTTDIFTNTFGTWAGVWLYNLLVPVAARYLPWLPFPLPAKGSQHG